MVRQFRPGKVEGDQGGAGAHQGRGHLLHTLVISYQQVQYKTWRDTRERSHAPDTPK